MYLLALLLALTWGLPLGQGSGPWSVYGWDNSMALLKGLNLVILWDTRLDLWKDLLLGSSWEMLLVI